MDTVPKRDSRTREVTALKSLIDWSRVRPALPRLLKKAAVRTPVKSALVDLGHNGLTVSEVKGRGI